MTEREIKMFLDNLSTSVLRLCDARSSVYEATSKQCDLRSRYLGDIARGKTAPTILTLGKLCVGFDLTPNELLIPPAIWRVMSFCIPMPVTQIRCFHFLQGLTGFPSALNAEGLWNANTSLTATAAGDAWIGKPSPKQPFCCLRSNAL